jgi:hypothetical protein
MEPREINYRQWLPWTLLFRGFWVALDPKKLMLAAAGIVVMAVGWWILALVFFNGFRQNPPVWPRDFPGAEYDAQDPQGKGDAKAWDAFKSARNSWNLLYEAAGSLDQPATVDAGDLAISKEAFDPIADALNHGKTEFEVLGTKYQKVQPAAGGPAFWSIQNPDGTVRLLPDIKPHGRLRTLPWDEDRGPNPYLMVTGRAGQPGATGAARHVPWTSGGFIDWFVAYEVPFLLEPLVKFIRPVVYLLSPSARLLDQIYFLLVIAWTVATWSLVGGAITRIAAVEVARNEKMGLGEAIRYFRARWRSYLFASFAPLLGLAVLGILLMLFGVFAWIPWFADLWIGFLFFIALAIGLAMAVVLVGMVGWPMIHTTLSAEGSDSFDALSRSYSYVLQKPWSYVWYVVVALVYGTVVVFFVGFMGSLMIYFAKWGIDSILVRNTARDPSYLFVYAPKSFHWQELLVVDSPVVTRYKTIQEYINNEFSFFNYIGAGLVAIWLGVFFLLIIGFSYSYFWCASTLIYLLMRRKVDDTELDEVYLEEEDSEEPYSAPVPAAPPVAAPAGAGTMPVQMVEAPTLRAPVATATAAPPVVETVPPKSGDGEAAPSSGSPS